MFMSCTCKLLISEIDNSLSVSPLPREEASVLPYAHLHVHPRQRPDLLRVGHPFKKDKCFTLVHVSIHSVDRALCFVAYFMFLDFFCLF